MKINSDFANKIIKNLQAEVNSLLQAETRNRTYSHSVSEKPVLPEYDFVSTQNKLKELHNKIATIRHAINKFNIETVLDGYDMTVDEGLGYMSVLHNDKSRLYEMIQIPEIERSRPYGSKEADIIHRNFNLDEVQSEYKRVCDELMKIQQAINIANLTKEFEVDVEL